MYKLTAGRYSIRIGEYYFSNNREILREWFINNELLSAWYFISRSQHNDYIVYFHKEEHMILFMLSFETMPLADIDTPVSEYRYK